MKSCGIVIEYNPMHQGHLYHLQQAKTLTQADLIVGVMSANFVQRGEPAIASKFIRTKAALENGVDLVIELPTIFSLQSADIFGQKAVKLLQMAQVNYMVFGSESNDLSTLKEISELSIRIDYFKEKLDEGQSYAKALQLDDTRLFPNDILAISYLRALKNTSIIPYSIQRTNQYHSLDCDQEILSASAIRHHHQSKIAREQSLISLDNPVFIDDFYPFIRYKLLTTSSQELQNIFLVSEGIQNQLIKNAMKYSDYPTFIEACVSRRYSKSRIQRILMHVLLNNTKDAVCRLNKLSCLRVLGFTQKGREYIKEKKLKVATKVADLPKEYALMEQKATQIYSLVSKEKDLLKQETHKIIILE